MAEYPANSVSGVTLFICPGRSLVGQNISMLLLLKYKFPKQSSRLGLGSDLCVRRGISRAGKGRSLLPVLSRGNSPEQS